MKPFQQNVYAVIFISSIFQVLFLSKSVSEHEGEKKKNRDRVQKTTDLVFLSGIDKTLASYQV